MRRPRFPVFALVWLVSALAGPGAAQPAPAPEPALFRWEGLARRNPGLVVFRSRWNPGVLELRDDLLRWADRKDPGKNLVLPVRRITAHALKCAGGPPAPCSEWSVSTRTETYVFREVPPAGGAALRRAFDALRGAYADVPSAEER
jgi:hypothetical protein